MENLEAQKLINKMQRGLIKSGIEPETLIADLKELRPYAIEEKDPLLTKVIRMTYEHLEQFGTFNIPIPDDQDAEADEEEEKPQQVIEPLTDEQKVESLEYLLSVMMNNHQKVNRLDLTDYKHLFLAFE